MQGKLFLSAVALLLFAGCATHPQRNVLTLTTMAMGTKNDDHREVWVLGDVAQLFFDEKGRLPSATEEFIAFGEEKSRASSTEEDVMTLLVNEFSPAAYVDLKINSTYMITFDWYSKQARKDKRINLFWRHAPTVGASNDWAFVSLRDNDGPTAEVPRLSTAIRRFVEEGNDPMRILAGVEELLKFTEGHHDTSLSLTSYKNLKYKWLFPSGRVRVDWYSEVDAKDKFCVLTTVQSKSEQNEEESAGRLTDFLREHSKANKDNQEEVLLCNIGRAFLIENGRPPWTTEEFTAFAEPRLSVSPAYKDLKITVRLNTTFDWYSDQTGESKWFSWSYDRHLLPKPLFNL